MKPMIPAMERKMSSGDLHSRLKTRKLLGVGETDDGDVHRSKLSQILGHSDQLYVKLPAGIRFVLCCSTCIFLVCSLLSFVVPSYYCTRVLSLPVDDVAVLVVLRLYGVTMLAVTVLLWHTSYSTDKDVVKCSVTVAMVCSGGHVFAPLVSAVQYGMAGGGVTSACDVLVLAAWLLLFVILLYYHGILAASKVRKSISTRTLAFSSTSAASSDFN